MFAAPTRFEAGSTASSNKHRGIDILVNKEAIMVTGTAIAIDGGKSLGLPPKSDQ